MTVFEIIPHVGVGSVKLGMTRNDVIEKLGEPEFEDQSRYGYLSGFTINFDSSDKVEFIELAKSAKYEALYRGQNLHALAAEKAIEVVLNDDSFDSNDPELGYSYIFKKLQLSLWRGTLPENHLDEDGKHFQAVGIGVDGYF